jgi:hypothetical protein
MKHFKWKVWEICDTFILTSKDPFDMLGISFILQKNDFYQSKKCPFSDFF